MKATIWGVLILAFGLSPAANAVDPDVLKREPIVFHEAMVQGETAEIFIDLEGLKKVIHRKRNLDVRDSGGETLLSYAIADGNHVAIQLLLNAKASTRLRFDSADATKSTVAHAAAEMHCLRCLGMLIAADRWLLHAIDSNGETAIFQAVKGAQSEQVLLLWALGADPHHKNKKGKTIFDSGRDQGLKMSAVLERIDSQTSTK